MMREVFYADSLNVQENTATDTWKFWNVFPAGPVAIYNSNVNSWNSTQRFMLSMIKEIFSTLSVLMDVMTDTFNFSVASC